MVLRTGLVFVSLAVLLYGFWVVTGALVGQEQIREAIDFHLDTVAHGVRFGMGEVQVFFLWPTLLFFASGVAMTGIGLRKEFGARKGR